MPLKGYKHLEETKRKMSESLKGKHHSEETKRKIGLANSISLLGNHCAPKGEKNYLWKGGISFEPYSTDWTETLKRSIRERDKYTCQICGKEPSTICHHIDYNKQNCCPDNLITLCHSCHGKTNRNRDYWIRKLENLSFAEVVKKLQ